MPQFRKEFKIDKKKLKNAKAFVCGLGQFEFFVNGKKVGSNFLDPGWTQYDKEAQYIPFDITDLLADGDNAMGVMLGNGFYNIPNERYYKMTGSFGAPKMKMVVILDTEDGAEYIVSDLSWKVTESPVTFSSIYSGEDYDARRLEHGWMLPGFDDSGWQTPLQTKSDAHLHSQPGQALHIANSLPPQTVSKTPTGHWLYDFGQNFSGITRIKVRGKKGDKIILRPGELKKDSAVTQHVWGTGTPHFYEYTIGQDDTYESWQPQFTYFGLRYAQVEGAVPEGTENPDSLPVIAEVTGLHTTANVPQTGTFICSNPLFNKTFELVDWAIRSNMASVLTDCPHREKLGWLEESNLMQHSLQYRYDMSSIYRKIMSDIAAAQHDNGCVPTIAPQYVIFPDDFSDTPEWGSTAIISPWYYYKWYGDPSLLQDYYEVMKKYHDYLTSRAEDNIVAYGLGDWYDIGPNPPGYAQLTSNGVTATATYYYNTTIMKEASRLLGKVNEAQYYDSLANEIRNSYNARFYNDTLGSYDRGSQTANAISLALGLTEQQNREKVLESLIRDIESRGYALTAGDIGYRYVLAALTDGGRSDVVFRMNNRYDVPGYGWQLAHGATALTESWQAYDFASNNHFMLGHIMEWLFSSIGGIRQGEESVAFNEIEIKPLPCGDINSATTSLDSPYGMINTSWQKGDKYFNLDVTIPANTTARVWIPATPNDMVTEHGLILDNVPGIHAVETIDGYRIIKVGSGSYSFSSCPTF